MMRERCLLPLMMEAMRTMTNPSSPTSCPTRASTRPDMDGTSVGSTFVRRTTGRFLTIVDLLQTGVFQLSLSHAVADVEEHFANASTIILKCDDFNALFQVGGSREEKPRNIIPNQMCTLSIFTFCCA